MFSGSVEAERSANTLELRGLQFKGLSGIASEARDGVGRVRRNNLRPGNPTLLTTSSKAWLKPRGVFEVNM